jgi:hypothetical protein
MSDETLEAKQHAPELLREARDMGWKPKGQFRGDVEHWVDADEYVRRGKQFIPILQATNRKLEAQLVESRGTLTQLEQRLTAATEAIEALKEVNSEVNRRALARSRVEVTREIKKAREDGDVDAELEAQSQLREIDAAAAEAEKKPTAKKDDKPAPASEQKIDPAYLEWVADGNQWFEDDPVKNGAAMGIAKKLRADPANAKLLGRAFYDRIGEEIEQIFGERREGKTDSGRGGGSGGGGGGKSTSRAYADLPADAKATCDRQAAKLVGNGRAFKTEADWRSFYTKQYFETEA